MTDDRRQVLEMLAAGRITTDEADRLLGALQRGAPEAGSGDRTGAPAAPAPRYLRVIVESDEDDDGPVKINVRVPLQLLRAGVRLASLLPAEAQDRLNQALRDRGFGVDVSQIKPENINELIDQLGELSVDVDQKQDNVRIKVFAE
jgi:hypothetical protein